jgi:hypothetical protein
MPNKNQPIAPDSPNPSAPSLDYIPAPQPRASGAVEFTPAFRAATGKAFQSTSGGLNKGEEAGFEVRRDGSTGPITNNYDGAAEQVARGTVGHLKQTATPNTLALVHTHPQDGFAGPSSEDIAAAKKSGKVLEVASRGGLWSIGPDGKVTQIYNNQDFMNPKKNPKSSVLDDVADMVSNHVGKK